jgi:lipid-binding SYLF domain-containing protein
LAGIAGLAGAVAVATPAAQAASARRIDADATQALRTLYATQPKAKELAARAKAILIFPRIYKGGFVIGDGALRVGAKSVGYYNISAASFGLQAGGQRFSYALFFMTDAALDYLNKSDGWQIGSGPSVVVVDQGAAKSITSTTLTQDVRVPVRPEGVDGGAGAGRIEDNAHPSQRIMAAMRPARSV